MINTSDLFKEVKANQKKLDECPKHLFNLNLPQPYTIGQKLVCQNCGGQLDAVKAFYYTKGYKAAGGNPNDIIQGFE
jgi:hypothetical protein